MVSYPFNFSDVCFNDSDGRLWVGTSRSQMGNIADCVNEKLAMPEL